MLSDKCWLPKQEIYDGQSPWIEYEDALYSIFKHDFLDTYPKFEGIRVSVKHYPIENGKEDAFFHITCKDYKGNGIREPDLRRCERIRWIRAFIENYKCDASLCSECDGVKLWREPYKNRVRIHILLEEERYVVILEERKTYFLLITAFYLDYEHALQKQLKHYGQYKQS